MPKIQDNFAEISSQSEPVPPGEYRAVLFEVEEKTSSGGLPQLVFKNRIIEGDHKDREAWDFVVLQTSKGEKNKVGLGRVKAYAEATLGEEVANGGELDTDDMLQHDVLLVIEPNTYTKDGKQVTNTKIAKVLPVG